jgi:DNA-binding GntR family transcriptional regulator
MADTLRNIIYQSIRDDITYGRLSPGERLLENQLAEQFKASRSPIREALRQLEAEGLITFDTRKGISISKLSVREVMKSSNVAF